MAELIPGAEYLYLENGSHAAPLECPTQVNEAIERFLTLRADRYNRDPVRQSA